VNAGLMFSVEENICDQEYNNPVPENDSKSEIHKRS